MRTLWRALPYQVLGTCATCGATRDDAGKHLFVAGVNPDSRICLGCVELAHGCRAPNYRRRQPQPAETLH